MSETTRPIIVAFSMVAGVIYLISRHKNRHLEAQQRLALQPRQTLIPKQKERVKLHVLIRQAILVIGSFLAACLGVWSEIRPTISVAPSTSYDASDPSAERFSITNNGVLPLWKPTTMCVITSWKDESGWHRYPNMGFLAVDQYERPPETLGPTDVMTTKCLMPVAIVQANAAVRVSIEIGYRFYADPREWFSFWAKDNLYRWKKTAKFAGAKNHTGDFIWTYGSPDPDVRNVFDASDVFGPPAPP